MRVAHKRCLVYLGGMGRPKSSNPTAMHIVAVRFTPEQKAELKILVDDHTTRFRELGRPKTVTESDVMRWLVADAVAAIKRRDAQASAPTPPPVVAPVVPVAVAAAPPPPPPVAAPIAPVTNTPKAPAVPKSTTKRSASKNTDYTGVELPAAWVPEHREVHRKCAAFLLAHPTVTQTQMANAFGFVGNIATNFAAFLKGRKPFPKAKWPTVDSVLASLGG